jgi:hypothetical protein
MKTKFIFILACISLSLMIGTTAYAQFTIMQNINRATIVPCGPAPHWIDNCAGGDDLFQSTATVSVGLSCTGGVPITFQGPVTIRRNASDAVAPVDPNAMCTAPTSHSGNFHIRTEIRGATLTAPAPGGGQFILKIGQPENADLQPSIGHIVEKTDNTLGCSFWCVYFKVFIPAGTFGNPTDMWLWNHDCCIIYSDIDRVPPLPGTTYSFPTCVGLWTDPLAGAQVAFAAAPSHTVYFPTLPQWGLIILGMLLLTVSFVYLRRRTIA